MSSGRIEPVVDQRGRGVGQLWLFDIVPLWNRRRRTSLITEESTSRRQAAMVKPGLAWR
jgi:hypothetical protein